MRRLAVAITLITLALGSSGHAANNAGPIVPTLDQYYSFAALSQVCLKRNMPIPSAVEQYRQHLIAYFKGHDTGTRTTAGTDPAAIVTEAEANKIPDSYLEKMDAAAQKMNPMSVDSICKNLDQNIRIQLSLEDLSAAQTKP